MVVHPGILSECRPPAPAAASAAALYGRYRKNGLVDLAARVWSTNLNCVIGESVGGIEPVLGRRRTAGRRWPSDRGGRWSGRAAEIIHRPPLICTNDRSNPRNARATRPGAIPRCHLPAISVVYPAGRSNSAMVGLSMLRWSWYAGLFGGLSLGLGVLVDHRADPHLVRVPPGHQRRPRRAAPGLIVKLGQRHPAAGERVDVRRRDFRPEAADVGVPQVVGQDEHDVRPWRGLPDHRSADEEQRQDSSGRPLPQRHATLRVCNWDKTASAGSKRRRQAGERQPINERDLRRSPRAEEEPDTDAAHLGPILTLDCPAPPEGCG